MPVDANGAMRAALHEHLARWGLRRFETDQEYLAWQARQLSASDASLFAAYADRKRSGGPRDEAAFYDLAARPDILPVLYSQRYDLYGAVGPSILARIGGAALVLDFGCGVGILTTFYACQFPDRAFVGIDRSPASIAVARRNAGEMGLANVRFECLDVEVNPLAERVDLILSTHAVLQHERDPGVPSESWRSFARVRDAGRQAAFERRTGLGVRLDRLSAVLDEQGRMLLFEKTGHLARRVPFQRALEERGFQPVESPVPIRYGLMGEVAEDGSLYHVRKGPAADSGWDESPEPDDGPPFDVSVLRVRRREGHAPLYENHRPSAQWAWERLGARRVIKETTRREPDGRELHVELGAAEGIAYLYCANTFDQRQLVIFEPARAELLDTYFQEIVSGGP